MNHTQAKRAWISALTTSISSLISVGGWRQFQTEVSEMKQNCFCFILPTLLKYPTVSFFQRTMSSAMTSPLPDLLLCVLIKTGWSSTGPFPWAEGKPHPNTNRGHKYRRWQSGDLMCSLEYCPTKFFKQFRTGSGQDLSARGSRKRQLKKKKKP